MRELAWAEDRQTCSIADIITHNIVASAPTNLASIVDSTSIHLTWTPPTPLRDTTGYRISLTGGGNSGTVDVSGGSTDNYTLTGLTRGQHMDGSKHEKVRTRGYYTAKTHKAT